MGKVKEFRHIFACKSKLITAISSKIKLKTQWIKHEFIQINTIIF